MIINPMFFYLMYVSEIVGMAMRVCGPLLLLASLFMFVMAGEYFIGKDDEKVMERWCKRLIPTGIIIFIIGILIPDKETLLMMQAASLATTDNVNAVFEGLKAAMDYAVTILK